MDFDPADGALWFTDNQVDRMGDDTPPGELNRATSAGLAISASPGMAAAMCALTNIRATSRRLAVVFPRGGGGRRHAADLGMSFYRGLRPSRLYYRGGIFSAQHGSWDRTMPVGARVMFTRVGPEGKARRQ